MEASPPESDIIMPGRTFRSRAYQLAQEPESLVTMAFEGRRGESSQTTRCGLTGLAGAWARDNFGQWEHEVYPGGDGQRELAFRLGINLAMYALCLDYKTDQVHVPFILRRHQWRER